MTRLGDTILGAIIISILSFLFGVSWGITISLLAILYVIIQAINMSQ